MIAKEFHSALGAKFSEVNGQAVVSDYDGVRAEYEALSNACGVLDLSFRSRICLTGADRIRFLHGQVTNDVDKLVVGQGCYAALITAKGRMETDLNIWRLENELLLDFEPGLASKIIQRLEKYVIADDVQVIDVSADYGLLSVQGPKARDVVSAVDLGTTLPAQPFKFANINDPALGEAYLMNLPRLGSEGFDLFVPSNTFQGVFEKLAAATKALGGTTCGWTAFEQARIEAGIPRFGVDMDETNLPLESNLEERAISFSKGCYIGQEVISRIKTYSEVAKALRGLLLPAGLKTLPVKGAKLFHAGKEIGYITSAVDSPKSGGTIALGYVRKEANQIGNKLTLGADASLPSVEIVDLPFRRTR